MKCCSGPVDHWQMKSNQPERISPMIKTLASTFVIAMVLATPVGANQLDPCPASPQTCEAPFMDAPFVPLPVPEQELGASSLAYTGTNTEDLLMGGGLLVLVGTAVALSFRNSKRV